MGGAAGKFVSAFVSLVTARKAFLGQYSVHIKQDFGKKFRILFDFLLCFLSQ